MSNKTSPQPLDPKWGELSSFHDPYVLANFVARPSDVLITTAPKAGTTWMQQILHQLRTGGDSDFFSIDEVVPWLEFPRVGKTWQQRLKHFESLPVPRVFKTHCTYPQTPGEGIAKMILTFRDPRDCCVSYYHHLCDMTDEGCERDGIVKPTSIEQTVEFWLESKIWYRNVQSWWPHLDDSNVLLLRYTDLKQDLASVMQRILDFLGWTLNEAQWPSVLRYCSFEWMQANAVRFMRQGHDTPMFKPGGFIRKGIVGDGKVELSASQAQRIVDQAYEMLDPECLVFLEIE